MVDESIEFRNIIHNFKKFKHSHDIIADILPYEKYCIWYGFSMDKAIELKNTGLLLINEHKFDLYSHGKSTKMGWDGPRPPISWPAIWPAALRTQALPP
jgi:hypothetical protein